MTEMVTSGSMSGGASRSDGLLGESGHESRRSQQAPPVLHATARVLDSTPITLLAEIGDQGVDHFGVVVDHEDSGDRDPHHRRDTPRSHLSRTGFLAPRKR